MIEIEFSTEPFAEAWTTDNMGSRRDRQLLEEWSLHDAATLKRDVIGDEIILTVQWNLEECTPEELPDRVQRVIDQHIEIA